MNTRIVIGPNASMTGVQAGMFFATVCFVAFGIAGVFAAKGYWPVLPFAGLEMAALGAALHVALRRNRYREVLSFEDDELRIEFGHVGHGAQSVCRLPRAWTKVRVEPATSPLGPTRLVLGCSGQRVEIGRCLTDDERRRLAGRLQELLTPGVVRDAWGPGPRELR